MSHSFIEILTPPPFYNPWMQESLHPPKWSIKDGMLNLWLSNLTPLVRPVPRKIRYLAGNISDSRLLNSVTQETSIHCWNKAGITGQAETEKEETTTEIAVGNTLSPVEQFIGLEQREYYQALSPSWDNGLDEYQDLEDFFDSYFADLTEHYEEQLSSHSAGKGVPDARTLILDEITAGVLLQSKNYLANTESESATNTDDLATSSLIGLVTAVYYTFKLSHYLPALPTTHLPLPGGNRLSLQELLSSTRKLHSGLLHYRNTRQVQQTSISQFFKPKIPMSILFRVEALRRSGSVENVEEVWEDRRVGDWGSRRRRLKGSWEWDLEKGKEREKSSGSSFMPAWDIEPKYIGTRSSESEDEKHATCAPTKWTTGGVNTADESLLR